LHEQQHRKRWLLVLMSTVCKYVQSNYSWTGIFRNVPCTNLILTYVSIPSKFDSSIQSIQTN
jgi:hypothetical protein